MRSAPRLPLLLGLSLALAGPASARDKLQMWTDANGVVHLEDAPPGTASRARHGSARGAAGRSASAKAHASAPAARWWERATDAPPDEIDRASALYNIPAELIRAVIAVESDGDTSAVSRAGAKGLMQLMPETAGHVYVDDPVDPAQNIQGGTRYLRELANQFNGDMVLVLAAYNAGPEAVRKYNGVPPFTETRGYVRKVIAHYNELKRETSQHKLAADASGNAASPELAQAARTQGAAP